MNRTDIENVLCEIGIPPSIKGFKYIIDAIALLEANNGQELSWTKEIYPEVGKMNKITGGRAERAIRHALRIARIPGGNHDAVEHYIGFANCENSSSLKLMYLRIKQKCNSDSRKSDKLSTEKSILRQAQEPLMWKLFEQEIRRIVKEELMNKGDE